MAPTLTTEESHGPSSKINAGDNSGTYLWRGMCFTMTVFFILAAYVQINDPDPEVWIPAYVVPALLTLAIVFKPDVTSSTVWRVLAVVDICVCIAGAIYLTIMVVEVTGGQLTNPLQHEVGRELAGLVIILGWLSACRFTTLGSSDPNRGAANTLLLMTGILCFLPLLFWSMCFVEGLGTQLAFCNEMFPGLLGS